MVHFLYRILYPLGFFLTWPFWILRDLIQHKPYHFKDKFLGPGRMLPKRQGRPRVWLWALSLGEVLAARKLVPALEEAGAEVVISSTTAIGREAAARTWPSRLVLSSPFDFSLSTRRFVDAVDPDLMVLVETDIWPGILFLLKRLGVPAVLLSVRMSPRSVKGYGYIRSFWGRVLRIFALITTQSEDSRLCLLDLGADPARTLVIGDLKFDREVKESTPEIRTALLMETGWPEGRWIVAGSTHAGEDETILGAFTRLKEKAKYWNLKLLLAPRNRSDFMAVWDLIKRLELPAGHRGEPDREDRNKDVFLLDTLGELDRFYDLAEIALVGKSWAGLHKGGGHNPLEPAAKGKPVIFGPLTHNYRWMTKALLEAGGAIMAPDREALTAALEDLLDNPDQARDMGRRAADFVRRHQGGVKKTMDLLRPFLERARSR
ncbi:MAG: hypothetical protein LBC90_01695 [Candidatus Adiutrix sp.]|jgi:3-deoxy-D-manno-octulosonic-acid transferase|nr:hypothetical protein [Candidatus Adiutrix sp.]